MGSKPIHFNDVPLDIKKNIILGYVRSLSCTCFELSIDHIQAHKNPIDHKTWRSQITMSYVQATTGHRYSTALSKSTAFHRRPQRHQSLRSIEPNKSGHSAHQKIIPAAWEDAHSNARLASELWWFLWRWRRCANWGYCGCCETSSIYRSAASGFPAERYSRKF